MPNCEGDKESRSTAERARRRAFDPRYTLKSTPNIHLVSASSSGAGGGGGSGGAECV